MSCGGVMHHSQYTHYLPYQRSILPDHLPKEVPEHDSMLEGRGGELVSDHHHIHHQAHLRGSPLPHGYGSFMGGHPHGSGADHGHSGAPTGHHIPARDDITPPHNYSSQNMLGVGGAFPSSRLDMDGGGGPDGGGGEPDDADTPSEYLQNVRDRSHHQLLHGEVHGLIDKVKGEKDKDMEGEAQRTAQYVSSNCVIFTYYAGDISKAVEDHFSKALSQSAERESVPLSARNFPPSFWDSHWVAPPTSTATNVHHPAADIYSEYTDPWQSYMASMTGYSAHQMYTARSYSSLLLQSRRDWVEQNYPPSPYSSMSGLDGSMQNGAKDLYWF